MTRQEEQDGHTGKGRWTDRKIVLAGQEEGDDQTLRARWPDRKRDMASQKERVS